MRLFSWRLARIKIMCTFSFSRFPRTVQQRFIRRDLSGSGLRIIVCKRLLIRELEDRFESQSRASRSGIALGVSPPGVSPQGVDHHLEGATIPRPITMAQRAKQLRQVIGGGHRRLAG